MMFAAWMSVLWHALSFVGGAAILVLVLQTIPNAAVAVLGPSGQALQALAGLQLIAGLTTTHLMLLAASVAVIEFACAAEAALASFNRKLAACVGVSVEDIAEANPGSAAEVIVQTARQPVPTRKS